MSTKELIAFLKNYNSWRRGEDDSIKQPDPRTIGLAIEQAIQIIEDNDKNKGWR